MQHTQASIRMSRLPLAVGSQFYGDTLMGDTIIGKPFEIRGPATREEFIRQFAPGEMSAETKAFLDTHPTLYFYRTQPLDNLIGLIAEICG